MRRASRIRRFVALGALVTGVLAVFASLALPLATVLGLLVISVASFVTAGYASLSADLPVRDVPGARRSVGMSARVAIDEAVLAGQSLVGALPSGADLERIREEVDAARELFELRGWLANPGAYHRMPPPLDAPRLQTRRLRRARRQIVYETVAFESGY